MLRVGAKVLLITFIASFFVNCGDDTDLSSLHSNSSSGNNPLSNCSFQLNQWMNGQNRQSHFSYWQCSSTGLSFQLAIYEDGTGFYDNTGRDLNAFTWKPTGCQSITYRDGIGDTQVTEINGSTQSKIISFKQTTAGISITASCYLVSLPPDTDSDGVDDIKDNCPAVPNVDQRDVNSNGIGDVCDQADYDADGIPDSKDNCPMIQNPNQSDMDANGFGDVCEPSAVVVGFFYRDSVPSEPCSDVIPKQMKIISTQSVQGQSGIYTYSGSALEFRDTNDSLLTTGKWENVPKGELSLSYQGWDCFGKLPGSGSIDSQYLSLHCLQSQTDCDLYYKQN